MLEHFSINAMITIQVKYKIQRFKFHATNGSIEKSGANTPISII